MKNLLKKLKNSQEFWFAAIGGLNTILDFVILFGIIFIGSLFANQDEIMKISLLDKYAIPMKEGFWLGSDSGGRSILGQLILGARNSIIIGFTITILTSGIGIFFGLIAGYYGKWVDNVIMRVIDFITILPTLGCVVQNKRTVHRWATRLRPIAH